MVGPVQAGELALADASRIAWLAVAAMAFVLARTVWGFRLRMLGLNPRAAQRSGVSANRLGTVALVEGPREDEHAAGGQHVDSQLEPQPSEVGSRRPAQRRRAAPR